MKALKHPIILFGVLFLLTLLGIAIPAIAGVASLAFGIWMIWVLLNFIMTLHGFELGKALIVMILSSIAAAALMVLLLGFFGVSLGGASPNA